MNTLLNGMKNDTNFTLTQNGGLTHKTTRSDLLDLFAMGAAMRNRSDEDVILMFRKAFKENPVYALKCLFYIRDVRGGQGERRFFRVVMRDLANWNTEAAKRNLRFVPEFGRWDDLMTLLDSSVSKYVIEVIADQLAKDQANMLLNKSISLFASLGTEKTMTGSPSFKFSITCSVLYSFTVALI